MITWFVFLLFVNAVHSLQNVTALFERPASAPVYIKFLGQTVYREIETQTKIHAVSEFGRSVFEICNLNPSCTKESLEFNRHCSAVTSTCNCLNWAGTINREKTTPGIVTVLPSSRKRCLMLFVDGSGDIAIDWYLHNSGRFLPSFVKNMNSNLKRHSRAGRNSSRIAFAENVIVPAFCNVLYLGPTCPSQTFINIEQIKYSYPKEIDQTILPVVVLIFVSLVFISALLQFRPHPRSISKQLKTE